MPGQQQMPALGQEIRTSAKAKQFRQLLPVRAIALCGLAALILLAACKPVGPDYKRPGYSAPATYKETGATTVVPPPNPHARRRSDVKYSDSCGWQGGVAPLNGC